MTYGHFSNHTAKSTMRYHFCVKIECDTISISQSCMVNPTKKYRKKTFTQYVINSKASCNSLSLSLFLYHHIIKLKCMFNCLKKTFVTFPYHLWCRPFVSQIETFQIGFRISLKWQKKGHFSFYIGAHDMRLH